LTSNDPNLKCINFAADWASNLHLIFQVPFSNFGEQSDTGLYICRSFPQLSLENTGIVGILKIKQ
jgi:hypothetical protein